MGSADVYAVKLASFIPAISTSYFEFLMNDEVILYPKGNIYFHTTMTGCYVI